jgi:hypothetical protein
MKHIQLLLLSALAILLFNTCKKDDPAPEPSKSGSVYNVTLTSNTVYIDSLDVQSLVHMDTAEHVYYFESSEPKIAGLKVDDILLIYGIALRRVTAISVDGGETRVETAYASLNEAIRDGEISWNKQISFKDGVKPVVLMNGKNMVSKSTGTDDFEFEFSYGAFNYRIKFAFTEKKADVEFEITKDLVKPITAKFLATGSLQNFSSSTDMVFANSKLTKFAQKNSDITGDLTLNLTVAGSGRDDIAFDFPVVLLKYPIMVGPIPVVISLKVLFVINCVVPVDGSAQVEVKFDYKSTTGFKYDGTNVSADASMGDQSMNKNIAQTAASSAIGVNFGLAFPRIEIGAFGEILVPWIQTAFLIGGDYTFTPACQQAKSQFIGACGIDLSLAGLGYNAKKTLWQEEKVLLKSGDCP